MYKKGVIFDLDGTLWSTIDTVTPVWNSVLSEHEELKRQGITIEEMSGYMGKTLDEIAKLALPELSTERGLEILHECTSREQKVLRNKGGKLYNGLYDTLKALNVNCSVYLVSNCQEGYAKAFLERHELSNLFSDVETAGRTGKSKGENIKLIIERNRLDKSIYVGDTEGDREAANFAGIPFVYASYGFGTAEQYDFKIDALSELPEAIKTAFE